MKRKLFMTLVTVGTALFLGNVSEANAEELKIQPRSYYYFNNYYQNNPNALKPVNYRPQTVYNQTEYIPGWLLSGTHYSLVVGRYGWVNKSRVYTFRFDGTWYPLNGDRNYQIKSNIRLVG